MRGNELKIGDKISISNDYYVDKTEIDIPFYGEVVDIDEKNSRIKYMDKEGYLYTADLWYVEKDNIETDVILDTNTKSEKSIKELIQIIRYGVLSPDNKKAFEAEDKIGEKLFDSEKDYVRKNNEVNVRKAMYKYEEIMTNELKDLDESGNAFKDLSNTMYVKLNSVQSLVDSLGIYNEYRQTSKKDNEHEVKLLGKNPADDLLGQVIGLKMINDFLDQAEKEINEKMQNLEDEDEIDDNIFGDDSSEIDDGLPSFMKGMASVKKPDKKKIPSCLIDMTDLAARGKYNDILGREDEIDTVAETLARKEIRNPLLIGKPGAGKTAVVEELVKRSYNGEIEHLANKHFYELRMNDLVAGTMYRGQLEKKLKDVMGFLEDDPSVVLFIDEVHMIVKAGSTSGEDKNDVANALKPYLTSEISIIGATTFDEYKATLQNDGALSRRFNPIVIEEKTKEEVIEIVCQVKERFENYHDVELSEDIIRDIVDEIDKSKLDNSLISGALTAVDTICTKMKIKHLTEEEAFDKWSNEVVLSVDQSNDGIKRGKIGFRTEKENPKTLERHEIISKQNLNNKVEEDNFEKLYEPDEEIINEEGLDELQDLDLDVLSRKEYIKLTSDESLEGYNDYVTKVINEELNKEVAEELDFEDKDDEDDFIE